MKWVWRGRGCKVEIICGRMVAVRWPLFDLSRIWTKTLRVLVTWIYKERIISWILSFTQRYSALGFSSLSFGPDLNFYYFGSLVLYSEKSCPSYLKDRSRNVSYTVYTHCPVPKLCFWRHACMVWSINIISCIIVDFETPLTICS